MAQKSLTVLDKTDLSLVWISCVGVGKFNRKNVEGS